MLLVRNAYDPVGNLTQVTDANGNVTTTGYNPRNLPDTVTYADNTTSTRTYDGVGNVLTYSLIARRSDRTPMGMIRSRHSSLIERTKRMVSAQLDRAAFWLADV